MKISLVILTYNEIVGLEQLFKNIPQDAVDEVFAVDGGSSDGTLDFFKAHGVKVYLQSVRGRGEAFRIAFDKAEGDALIFFSPDGNEDPTDIPRFRPFLEDGADMVIGNRMSDGGHNEEDEEIFKPRKLANNIFTLVANLAWNRKCFKGGYIYDTINGYRAIKKSAWNILKPDGPGYTIEYQSSIRAMKNNLKVVEFPTYESVRIDNRVGSPSISTGLAFVKMFFRELLACKA